MMALEKRKLVWYYDAEYTKPLPVDASGRPLIDLVRSWPGKERQDHVFVRNETNEMLELEPVAQDPDTEISEFPKTLQPQQGGRVTVRFAPKADRENSLRAPIGFILYKG